MTPVPSIRWIVPHLLAEHLETFPADGETDERRAALAERILKDPTGCGRPRTLDAIINRAWAYLAREDARRAVTELRQFSELSMRRYPGALKIFILALLQTTRDHHDIARAFVALSDGYVMNREHTDDVRALGAASQPLRTGRRSSPVPQRTLMV